MSDPYDMLHEAAALAVSQHRGQDRKSSPLPYVSHCFDVMKQLSIWGVIDKPLLTAALLHDTVEDTSLIESVLRRKFGDEVGDIVMAVTWPSRMGKPAKYDHLGRMRERASSPRRLAQILLLKMADRMCNVTDYKRARNDDLYASTYALLGFPVFWLWLEGGSDGWSAEPKLTDELTWSLASYETVVREKYDTFRIYSTTFEEARELLFPPRH